jgi:hypothetical protein
MTYGEVENMADIDYVARVAKGVALLDEKRPGWERLIDLETLDIENGTSCVTAQLSGAASWGRGMSQLGLTLTPYTGHGFRAEDEEGGDLDLAYATLNRLWREVITEKLAVPTES